RLARICYSSRYQPIWSSSGSARQRRKNSDLWRRSTIECASVRGISSSRGENPRTLAGTLPEGTGGRSVMVAPYDAFGYTAGLHAAGQAHHFDPYISDS